MLSFPLGLAFSVTASTAQEPLLAFVLSLALTHSWLLSHTHSATVALTFGAEWFFAVRRRLIPCFVECLAASLPLPTRCQKYSNCYNQNCLQTLWNVPWDTKSSLVSTSDLHLRVSPYVLCVTFSVSPLFSLCLSLLSHVKLTSIERASQKVTYAQPMCYIVFPLKLSHIFLLSSQEMLNKLS